MRAAIYIRISQDREGKELGSQRQREDCEALAARLGATVVDVYADNDIGASTRSRKPRPEYRRLLADARRGRIDTIIAYTSGRLTRRPREHEDQIELAEQHGVSFRYVSSPSFDLDTSAGRRIARILAANDAGEAEDIAERVKREALQKAEQGRHHGGPRMFGVDRQGRVLVEEESVVVREMYATILAGGSISGIRKSLNARGLTTAAGRPWNDSSIRVILLNPRNAGIRELGGVQYPASNPPIVPVETYRACRAILCDPARRTNVGRTARRWIGAGLYRCERCDRPVRTSYDGTAVKGWRVYICAARDGGCARSWKGQPIDDWVYELVEGIIAREDGRQRLLPSSRPGVDVAALHAEASAVEANMAGLAVEYALAKGPTRAALAAGLRAGEARLDEINADLTEAGGGGAAWLAEAADPVAAWRAIDDVAVRQSVIRLLMTISLGAPIRGRAKWEARKFIVVEPRG